MAQGLSDAWFHRLKSATRDLVVMTGGVVRAGERCGASKSEVSRWQSAESPDIIPIPAALALEAECGVPIVTTAMAELHGRRLSDPEAEGRAAAGVIASHAEVMRRGAEVAARMASALDDGVITPAEAEIADRAAAELANSIAAMRGSLAGVRAVGAEVTPLRRPGGR